MNKLFRILAGLLSTSILVSQEFGFSYGEVVINTQADHSNIKSIIVMAEGTTFTAKGNIDDTAEVQRKWERILMRSGYDAITRIELDAILREQSLVQSGLTREEEALKAGEIVGADAIFFVEEERMIKTVVTSSETTVRVPNIIKTQLISVRTGQILFISDYDYSDSGIFGEEELRTWIEWLNTLFDNYKSKVKQLSTTESNKQ